MPSLNHKIRLCLLWHMHQPYYKDLFTGVYRLPWTRMHALKDYYGMVALFEEFPTVHATFNLVPSLLTQLEEYAVDQANEPVQQIAYKPADELRMEDHVAALNSLFQANVDHLISRYPRYRELYDRYAAAQFSAERALPFFQKSDFADLQVLSQLAWFDEFYHDHDPAIQALTAKGRGYTVEDQALLRERQQHLLRQIIPAYRRAAERGQIEISTSPFYHPILPLLCDTDCAREPHPGVPLPRQRFMRPEDARTQLDRAIALHTRMFGSKPAGVWPSEGSVSPQVAELCASLGFRWMATDQRILGNSLGMPFYRNESGELINAHHLYQPYRYDTPSGAVDFLFRDQEFSDLIGFVYSRMDAQAAAADLVGRIQQSAAPVLRQGQDALVPVILDGENAWEYYPRSGREFLRALYGRLASDTGIECLTVSEALHHHGAPEKLPRLATGSWIGANFDIWIGADEDNQAWNLLHAAREFFDQHAADASAKNQELALEELLIAEGSDWCWWYGPEHSTANDADFDSLFRAHLANVYRSLGGRVPDALAQPIAHIGHAFVFQPPTALIRPQIDGRVTSYFEWMGSGIYIPDLRATTMHGHPSVMREVHFGRSDSSFYLRVNFAEPALAESLRQHLHQHALRVNLRQGGVSTGVRVDLALNAAGKTEAEQWSCALLSSGDSPSDSTSLGKAACKQVFELSISLAALLMDPTEPFEFQISLWQDSLPVESLPLDGWLVAPANPQEIM
ncbi:MAG: glycoside hydrolase [Acidobacteria bacterium]|nr:glycoside hydrolase [Acidobacteriota bacterium]